MTPNEARRRWVEIGLFTAAAFLLYQVRSAFFLSAVPLFLLGFKRGREDQLYGAALFLLFVGVQALIRVRGFADPQLRTFFAVVEMGYPVGFVGGVLLIHWRNGRSLYGMLEAAALIAALSIPFFLIFAGNAAVTGFLTEQIRSITTMLQEALAQGGASVFASTDDAIELVKDLFFRNFLFSYFLLLSADWALAVGIHGRVAGGVGFKIEKFSVPETLLWPLLGLWALVLIDVLADMRMIGYAAWNGGMILLFVYALQGIAILRVLFRRYGVGKGLRIMVTAASVFVLLTPGINLVLIIGVPLLGVSEYWVHYRIGEGD
jgi:hypothetical protein